MFSIALSTFKEVYRKRIVHIIGILTIIYLIILGYIMQAFGKNISQNQGLIEMITDFSSVFSILGFYFSSMLLAFLTVMLSIGIVSHEVENGTVLTIITKPIYRYEYILGKYIGTAALVVIYSVLLYTAVIIISGLSGISLINTFGIPALLKGFLFFTLEPLTILALSLYGSTIFKTLNNGVFIIAIYILGTIGGIIEQIGSALNRQNLATFGILSSLVSPFDVTYRKMISTIFSSVGGFNPFTPFAMAGKSTTPSIWMMIYVGIYMLLFIFLSIKGFSKKDIG